MVFQVFSRKKKKKKAKEFKKCKAFQGRARAALPPPPPRPRAGLQAASHHARDWEPASDFAFCLPRSLPLRRRSCLGPNLASNASADETGAGRSAMDEPGGRSRAAAPALQARTGGVFLGLMTLFTCPEKPRGVTWK